MLFNSVLVLMAVLSTHACVHTHTQTHTLLFVADCTDVSSACCLCVPESAARRVMEHALLNDESEYSREKDKMLDQTEEIS